MNARKLLNRLGVLLFAVLLLPGGLLQGATVTNLGLAWANFSYNSTGRSTVKDLCISAEGTSYLLADFPADSTFDGTPISGAGSYVIKQSSSGEIVWTLQLAGGGLSQLSAGEIEMGQDGNILVAGYYAGSGTIAGQAATPKGEANAFQDFFLVKIRPDSTAVWLVTEDMNVNTSSGQSLLKLDAVGNILVHTHHDLAASVGSYSFPLPASGQGYLLTRYSSTSALISSQSISQKGYFACGPSGSIFFAHEFSATHQWGSQEFTSTGGTNIILSRLAADGSVTWAVQGGGNGVDAIKSIAADASGNVYLAGVASGTISFGGTSHPDGAFEEGFLAAYDPDGNFRWLKPFHGPANELPLVATGPGGNVHVMLDMAFGNTTVDGEVIASTSADELAVLTFTSAGELIRVARTAPLAYAFSAVLAVPADDRPVIAGNGGVYNLDGFQISDSSFNFFTARVGPRRSPIITRHPESLMLPVGEVAEFSAGFDASAPYAFYWKKNGQIIAQTSEPYFSTAPVNLTHNGNYSLLVSNSVGTAESDLANLWVIVPPAITAAPSSTNVWDGETLKLTFTATSTLPYDIRWYRNSVLLDGATAAVLTVSNVNLGHEGTYSVTISNEFGTSSAGTVVRVNHIPTLGHVDMVENPLDNRLYITASNQLHRFVVTNRTFIIGGIFVGNVGGMDISEDFRFLALASSNTAGLVSRIVRVELDTLIKTNFIHLTRTNGSPAVVRSVAFGHGSNLVATLDGPNMPAFWVDIGTLESTQFGSNTYHYAHVAGSAGRNVQAMISTKVSPARFDRLDADNRTITAGNANIGDSPTDAAVSRDGQHTLVSRIGKVLNASGQVIATLSGPGFPLGAAYHPQSNYVYCTWSDTAEIRVFETTNYTQVATLPIGTALTYSDLAPYAPGRLRISVDGNRLFCSLPDGIRLINLPLSPPIVLTQPVSETKMAGTPVSFSAQATLTAGLRYQWQRNGEDILNATNSTYSIAFLQGGHEGTYRVRAINAAGFNYSQAVQLDVLKGDPGVAWSNPSGISYGTLLGAAQLNATAGTAGAFIYDPPAGTKLPVGDDHRLQMVFVPDDLEAFETVTNVVFIDVQKKVLTVSPSNVSRQYGLANPAFPFTLLGLAAGESVADIDVPPLVSSAATETSAPGTYPISSSGGSDDNYSFVYGSATLTVTKRTVAFSLSNLSQAYNGTPRPVTVTTDPPSGVPMSITYNSVATVPTSIGSYTVRVNATGANYEGGTTNTLTIFKGSAPVTWNTPASITYGTALGTSQLNASSTLSGIYSYTPVSGTVLDAGTHTLTLVFTPIDSANYLRSTNTVTLEVTRKTLSVDATAASRTYGAANPALSGTLTGLRAGDNITAQYSSAANLTSAVVSYPITAAFTDPGSRLGNYTVQTNGAQLSVTKASLTIKANNASRTYGTTNVTYTAQFTGLKNSDVIPVTLTSTATAGSAPGTYPITVAVNNDAVAPASNYTITLQEGTLTVTVGEEQTIIFSESIAPYVERSGARLLDPLALVTNIFEMSGAIVTLNIPDGKSYEQLSLLSEGSAEGQIDLDGSIIRESGNPIATIISTTTVTGTDTLRIDFNFDATMAQATKVLRRIAYNNTSGNPNPVARSVIARLADINGGITDPASCHFTISLRNDPPTVAWVLPGSDRVLKAGHPVTLEVNATDVDGTVTKVEFWVNDQKVGERTAPPYRHTWTPASIMIPTFEVIATDNTGDTTESVLGGLPFEVVPAAAQPRFTATPGEFRFDFVGLDDVEYDLEVSTDLIVWTRLTTITAQTGSVPIVDPNTLGVSKRFYRLVPKP